MRGVGALPRRTHRQHIGGGRRAIKIDAGALPRGVFLGDQDIDRRVDEGGIAKIARAVGVSAFHGFDHDVERRRGALLHVRHRKPFENVQRLQQNRAAGGGQRHRYDVVAAVVAAHRPADDSLIGFQIVHRHDAADIADGLCQPFGDRPLIKSARSLFGNRRERCGEVGLDQPVALFEGYAVVARERLRRIRPARHPPIHIRQRVGHVVGDHKTVARQFDGGFQDLFERETARAVFLQRQRQPGDRAGHADAKCGISRLFGIGLAVGSQKNVARDRTRRGLAIIYGDILVAPARMNHHKTAAADVSGARIGDGKRKAGGDRGVDRIAALPEDVGTDLRGEPFLRHHHAMLGRDGANGSEIGGRVSAAFLRKGCRSAGKRKYECGGYSAPPD